MNTAVLSFEGFIAGPVRADGDLEDSAGMTIRIGGDDVLAALAEAVADLRDPIDCQVHLGFGPPVIGPLAMTRGHNARCCDRCCGPTAPDDCDPEVDHFEDAGWHVGDLNVLGELELMVGDQTRLDIHLVGAR